MKQSDNSRFVGETYKQEVVGRNRNKTDIALIGGIL